MDSGQKSFSQHCRAPRSIFQGRICAALQPAPCPARGSPAVSPVSPTAGSVHVFMQSYGELGGIWGWGGAPLLPAAA